MNKTEEIIHVTVSKFKIDYETIRKIIQQQQQQQDRERNGIHLFKDVSGFSVSGHTHAMNKVMCPWSGLRTDWGENKKYKVDQDRRCVCCNYRTVQLSNNLFEWKRMNREGERARCGDSGGGGEEEKNENKTRKNKTNSSQIWESGTRRGRGRWVKDDMFFVHEWKTKKTFESRLMTLFWWSFDWK